MTTLGSLFTGYGGLDLATETALGPLDHRWHAENGPAASKVLTAHWPATPNLGDVTTVDWATVEPVDVLAGSFPCTDVSAAGRRAGLVDGNPTGLWFAMATAIAALRPSLVIAENVKGLLHAGADSNMEHCAWCVGTRDGKPVPALRALGRVLGDLADLGFDAVWATVPASAVGAPHRRDRVFLVAWPTHSDGVGVGHPGPTSRDRVPAVPVPGTVRPRLTLLPTPMAHDDGKSPAAHLATKQRMPGGTRTQITSLGVLARAGFEQPLLPTPRASDMNGAKRHGGGGPDLPGAVAALLPTPTAHLADRGMPSADLAATRMAGRSNLEDAVALLPTPRATRGGSATETTTLLPTPRATDGTNGGPNQRGSAGDLMLPSAVAQLLLPTPTSRDGKGVDLRGDVRSDGRPRTVAEHSLPRVAREANPSQWGHYADAVTRWADILGRPAPPPTEPGTRGQPALSPKFVEWMMGLPDGWVTSVPGLSRTAQLRILGNGVVPAQGAAALHSLLTGAA